MSGPATQLAAVAAFLADFPELRPLSVRMYGNSGTEIHVYVDDLPEWLDALELLPPSEDAWIDHTDEFLRYDIPATDDRPFSLFALRRVVAGRAVA